MIELRPADFERLKPLHTAYKLEIGEDVPTEADYDRLRMAMASGAIRFFGGIENGELVGCCSIAPVFSTYCYGTAGVFEDFYILPDRRHSGIARALVRFAVSQSGVRSLTVGCADCDREMYAALEFTYPLGNMLAFEFE